MTSSPIRDGEGSPRESGPGDLLPYERTLLKRYVEGGEFSVRVNLVSVKTVRLPRPKSQNKGAGKSTKLQKRVELVPAVMYVASRDLLFERSFTQEEKDNFRAAIEEYEALANTWWRRWGCACCADPLHEPEMPPRPAEHRTLAHDTMVLLDESTQSVVLQDGKGRPFAEFQCDEPRVVAAALQAYVDMLGFANKWVDTTEDLQAGVPRASPQHVEEDVSESTDSVVDSEEKQIRQREDQIQQQVQSSWDRFNGRQDSQQQQQQQQHFFSSQSFGPSLSVAVQSGVPMAYSSPPGSPRVVGVSLQDSMPSRTDGSTVWQHLENRFGGSNGLQFGNTSYQRAMRPSEMSSPPRPSYLQLYDSQKVSPPQPAIVSPGTSSSAFSSVNGSPVAISPSKAVTLYRGGAPPEHNGFPEDYSYLAGLAEQGEMGFDGVVPPSRGVLRSSVSPGRSRIVVETVTPNGQPPPPPPPARASSGMLASPLNRRRVQQARQEALQQQQQQAPRQDNLPPSPRRGGSPGNFRRGHSVPVEGMNVNPAVDEDNGGAMERRWASHSTPDELRGLKSLTRSLSRKIKRSGGGGVPAATQFGDRLQRADGSSLRVTSPPEAQRGGVVRRRPPPLDSSNPHEFPSNAGEANPRSPRLSTRTRSLGPPPPGTPPHQHGSPRRTSSQYPTWMHGGAGPRRSSSGGARASRQASRQRNVASAQHMKEEDKKTSWVGAFPGSTRLMATKRSQLHDETKDWIIDMLATDAGYGHRGSP